MNPIAAGDRVALRVLPSFVAALDAPAQRAFTYALGRTLVVDSIDERGLLVLLLGAEYDAEQGGAMNDVRVEPEYVERR